MPGPHLLELPPQSGVAFTLAKGLSLMVVTLDGAQVADIAAYSAADVRERFSPGRTIDYAESISLTTGSILYSNRSTPMLEITRDDVGKHDCLLSPCSERMFELLRGQRQHPSCHANLSAALAQYGIGPDDVQSTFNAFMNVNLDSSGRLTIAPPLAKHDQCIVLKAQCDVVIGLAACSSEASNGGICKRIGYVVSASQEGDPSVPS